MTTARTRLGSAPASRHAAMWGAIGAMLALPAIAMRFTSEVAWDRADFAAAAMLLVGAGAAFEVVTRVTRKHRYRIPAGLAIAFGVAAIWADVAVGIV